MRRPRLPKIRRPRTPRIGAHRSRVEPPPYLPRVDRAPAHYRGKRRAEHDYVGHARQPTRRAVSQSQPRSFEGAPLRRTGYGKRLTPADDRPHELRSSPRTRFADADVDSRTRARIAYAAGEAHADRANAARRHRPPPGRPATMGQPQAGTSPRERFAGEVSGAERKRMAQQLPTHGPKKATGTARRPNATLPATQSKTATRAINRDPAPALSGHRYFGDHPKFRGRAGA